MLAVGSRGNSMILSGAAILMLLFEAVSSLEESSRSVHTRGINQPSSFKIVAVLLATAGAVLSIKNFENSFSNTHQRIGLVLYALLWIQPLIGIFRPNRGVKLRSLWYFIHWLLGTGISVAGIINIYIGLHAYHAKTSRTVMFWTSLFTLEVVIIAFVYLFQDRWAYAKKQGVILGEEQITPTDHVTPPRINNEKKLGVLFQMVESQ